MPLHNAVVKGGGIIGTPCVTGNSWECKKVSGYKTIIFFGLVALTGIDCIAVFLPVWMKRLVVFCHKASISY